MEKNVYMHTDVQCARRRTMPGVHVHPGAGMVRGRA